MLTRGYKVLLLILIVVFSLGNFFIPDLYSAEVTLTWEANSEPYLGGYKLHYGKTSRDYAVTIDVGNQTSYTLDLEGGNTYYFSVTAVDESGAYESDFSNEVRTTIPLYTIYEDAEDGSTERWYVSDPYPPNSSIKNIFDAERNSWVMQLSGAGLRNSYSLTTAEGDNWHNSTQSVIEWSMRYDETFIIYIVLKTTAGFRILYYTPVDYNLYGQRSYVHYGLGSWAQDGQWHTFVRDLRADLRGSQPGVEIIEVNSFFIRGSGRIDDIRLYNPLSDDPDRDLISEEYEIAFYRTDPNKEDSDGDGIGDGIELSYWGERFDIDYDGDGINNLLDEDSDNDGFLDGIEITLGSDPADDLSIPTF